LQGLTLKLIFSAEDDAMREAGAKAEAQTMEARTMM
jgi:hypothetical protein